MLSLEGPKLYKKKVANQKTPTLVTKTKLTNYLFGRGGIILLNEWFIFHLLLTSSPHRTGKIGPSL